MQQPGQLKIKITDQDGLKGCYAINGKYSLRVYKNSLPWFTMFQSFQAQENSIYSHPPASQLQEKLFHD